MFHSKMITDDSYYNSNKYNLGTFMRPFLFLL